jgi:uncharacterized protein (DUF1800 family)
MSNNIKQIRHLYARAGFGMRFEDIKQAGSLSVKQAVDQLFKSSEAIVPLTVVKDNPSYEEFAKTNPGVTRKEFVLQRRQLDKDLNTQWVNKMSTGNEQLREKMTLFWHNHFACRTPTPWLAQELNNIHRKYALGNFKTLLLEVSKSPAMLKFLNNQQNRKDHPNENFARELMELFTIGRGNYTEQDVRESARAFTGWAVNKDGIFVAAQQYHDAGVKTFLGKSGNLTGEDIIDTILAKKETARFLSTKLYKYLVNETPDTVHINEMADVFYNSNYEIKPLLNFVFNADWFYDDKNVANLIKSPADFIVGLNRQFYIAYKNPEILLQFQRTLGQLLFYPPNVAGWPGGRNWVDSSSLMFRLKIPSTVLNGGVIDFAGKADPEDEAFLATMRTKQQTVNTEVQSAPNWNKFMASIPANTSKKDIAQVILAPALNNDIMEIVNGSTDTKSMVIKLVSTLEYQLC